jgi:N-acetylmuramoyl-L-alanine amidase
MNIVRTVVFLFCIFIGTPSYVVSNTMILVIDPAGDSQHPGRIIEGTFERTIAWHCAEYIRHQLETQNQGIYVAVTRNAGDFSAPLQRAQYVNRLPADFVISLHFYQEHQVRSQIYLYTFSYGDDFITITNPLGWYSYDQAHLFHGRDSFMAASAVQAHLARCCVQHADVHGPYKIPCAPLLGMTVPACMIEIGLKKADDWQWYGDHIADALRAIMTSMHV